MGNEKAALVEAVKGSESGKYRFKATFQSFARLQASAYDLVASSCSEFFYGLREARKQHVGARLAEVRGRKGPAPSHYAIAMAKQAASKEAITLTCCVEQVCGTRSKDHVHYVHAMQCSTTETHVCVSVMLPETASFTSHVCAPHTHMQEEGGHFLTYTVSVPHSGGNGIVSKGDTARLRLVSDVGTQVRNSCQPSLDERALLCCTYYTPH